MEILPHSNRKPKWPGGARPADWISEESGRFGFVAAKELMIDGFDQIRSDGQIFTCHSKVDDINPLTLFLSEFNSRMRSYEKRISRPSEGYPVSHSLCTNYNGTATTLGNPETSPVSTLQED
jgi:hypothetical protein